MKIIVMIRKLLFTVISFILVFAVVAQQPENAGFELWEDVGLDEDEPVDWSSIKTSDGGALINGFAPYVWEKSTDAHTGIYSVKLICKNTIVGPAPGTVTSGRIHAELSGVGWAFTIPGNADWSTPISVKPDSVAVWAKFTQAGTDVAQVKALLHTGDAKIPDPSQTNYIAEAFIGIPNSVATWTRFSAPFDYYNTNDPEYILFVLSTADEVATLGSEANYDDLELIYVVILEDLTVFMEGPYLSGSEMSTDINPEHLPLSQPYNVAPWNYNGTESVASIPNSDVVDWVLIEVRDAASAASASSLATEGMQAGFLLKDGSVVGLDGSSRIVFNNTIINNELFVVVHHRNHLSVMSGYPLAKVNGVYNYDFSDAEDKIYGGADGNVQLEMFGPVYGVW